MKLLKFTLKTIKYTIFAPFLVFAIALVWLKLTPFELKDLPQLKTGDIVLQTHLSSQSLAISFASLTPYTHTGIVMVNNKGEPEVIEAVGPVRVKKLENWIKSGIGQRVTIVRLDTIGKEQALNVISSAKKMLGLPYDYLFTFGDDAIYCSELVYNAFRDGTNINLGKVQKVKELNVNNFAVRDLIKKRWRSFPYCNNSDSFESCNEKIMNQELVTPDSLARDRKLKLIYSNYRLF